MQVVFDFCLILFGTFLFFKAYKQALDKEKTCPSAFVLLVIYVFNCLPIAFNYIVGIPKYTYMYWYKPFNEAVALESVNILYDIYILASMFFLYRFALKKNKKSKNYLNKKEPKWFFDNKLIWFLFILSPFLYLILTGQFKYFYIYGGGNNGYTTTEASNGFFNLYTYILLSCFGFCNVFFSRKIKKRDLLVILVYSIALVYICGKRYIVAILFILYLYYFVNSDNYNERTKKMLSLLLPLVGVFVFVFSAVYLVAFKGTDSNMYADGGFDALYDTLRVDFGRDDVVKYVIWKELFAREPILDYHCQSFISLLFIFVPRSLWHSKPYQHYQYLTASILNVSIDQLPAGTTPSWYEMCVANFGVFGFLFGVILLTYLCVVINRIHSKKISAIALMLIIALLTQGLDAYVGFIALLIVAVALKIVFGTKRLVLVSKNV